MREGLACAQQADGDQEQAQGAGWVHRRGGRRSGCRRGRRGRRRRRGRQHSERGLNGERAHNRLVEHRREADDHAGGLCHDLAGQCTGSISHARVQAAHAEDPGTFYLGGATGTVKAIDEAQCWLPPDR